MARSEPTATSKKCELLEPRAGQKRAKTSGLNPLAHSSCPSVRIREITDLTGLLSLRPDWDRLFEASSDTSVFQSFEWLCTWWRRCPRGDLLVLVAERNGETRCIAPLALVRERLWGLPYRRLRFIGSDPTETTRRNLFDKVFSIDRRCGWADRLDFLYEAADVDGARAILAYLEQHRERWDVLDLRELACRSETVGLVREVFGTGSVICEVAAQAAVLSVGEDLETYKRSLGRNWRKNISRTFNRVNKLPDVACIRYTSPKEVARMVPKTVDLESRSWQGRRQVGVFSHEGARAFHSEVAPALAKQGRLVLYTLESAGRVICHQYVLVHNRQMHLYSTAMDPQFKYYSPGFYLITRIIEDAFADEIQRIVLGRGPEEYKHKLKTADEDRIGVRVFGAGIIGRLLKSLEFKARPTLQRLVRNHSQTMGAQE